MSASESKYRPYVYALTEQVELHLSGLDELREMFASRPLSFNERSACERNIQVLVEAAIGCSKHLLKALAQPVPSEARAAIERVYERLATASIAKPLPSIASMRGAVGMRNAIIHDYLNLEWRRLEEVLRSRAYSQVVDYVRGVCSVLLVEGVR